MTKFQKLREDVSNRVESERKYWDFLYNIIQEFGGNFSQYLGLESNQAIDENGNPIGIIKVGRLNDGQFEQCAYWLHDKDGKNLTFYLCLNLPGEDTMQREVALIDKVILGKPDIFGNIVNLRTSPMLYEVPCEIKDGKVDLTPFFDALYQDISSRLDIHSL